MDESIKMTRLFLTSFSALMMLIVLYIYAIELPSLDTGGSILLNVGKENDGGKGSSDEGYVSGKQGTAKMFLHLFDREEYPDAVCNDGTMGGYYFAPSSSSGEQANVFLIHLPGGGQCFDAQSCASRWVNTTHLMSIEENAAVISVSGLRSDLPTKTPLWAANKASLVYCSSDGYVGNVGASEATWGYSFRGAALVQAMVQELKKKHKLDSAKLIVFAGTSAGARGVMTQIDFLASSAFPPSAQVVGFLDSPYWIDVQPNPAFSASFKGFQYEQKQIQALYNTEQLLSSSSECPQFYHNDATLLWKCLYGSYRLRHIKTPYFLAASQYDKYQLEEYFDAATSLSEQEKKWAAQVFAATTVANLTSLAQEMKHQTPYFSSNSRSSSGSAVVHLNSNAFFSWACYNHATSSSDRFSTLTTNDGVTMKDAFGAYLNSISGDESFEVLGQLDPEGGGGTKVERGSMLWIDDCDTFACGKGCIA